MRAGRGALAAEGTTYASGQVQPTTIQHHLRTRTGMTSLLHQYHVLTVEWFVHKQWLQCDVDWAVSATQHIFMHTVAYVCVCVCVSVCVCVCVCVCMCVPLVP